jgi:hypothetical protein
MTTKWSNVSIALGETGQNNDQDERRQPRMGFNLRGMELQIPKNNRGRPWNLNVEKQWITPWQSPHRDRGERPAFDTIAMD